MTQRSTPQISLADSKSRSQSSQEDLAELASIQEDIGLLSLLHDVGPVPAWNSGGEKGDLSALEVCRA
jgi:hypothetical protein